MHAMLLWHSSARSPVYITIIYNSNMSALGGNQSFTVEDETMDGDTPRPPAGRYRAPRPACNPEEAASAIASASASASSSSSSSSPPLGSERQAIAERARAQEAGQSAYQRSHLDNGPTFPVMWHNAQYDYDPIKRNNPVHKKSNPNVNQIKMKIHEGLGQYTAIRQNWVQINNDISLNGKTALTVHALEQASQLNGYPLVYEKSLYDHSVLKRQCALDPAQISLNAISTVNLVPANAPRAALNRKGGSKDAIDEKVRKAMTIRDVAGGKFILFRAALCVVVLRDMKVKYQGGEETLNRPHEYSVAHPALIDASIGPNRVNGFGPIQFSLPIVIALSSYDDFGYEHTPSPNDPLRINFFYDDKGCLFTDAPNVHLLPQSDGRQAHIDRITEHNKRSIRTLYDALEIEAKQDSPQSKFEFFSFGLEAARRCPCPSEDEMRAKAFAGASKQENDELAKTITQYLAHTVANGISAASGSRSSSSSSSFSSSR